MPEDRFQMGRAKSVDTLTRLGRVQLSRSFFLREFLHSETAQVYGLCNAPDDPQLAIAAGRRLCGDVLQPIHDALGRVVVRGAYRSCEVNAMGSARGHSCARNESAYARHIWDRRDARGFMGAAATIVVPSFLPYYERTRDWTALAWWIHDHVPAYAWMHFFPQLSAFNIAWHEDPDYPKQIRSYVRNPHTGDRTALTRIGDPSFQGSHARHYRAFLQELEA